MATDRPPKRVLSLGCREWVLDSASDQTSRFFGMDRCMLRELFCDLYLRNLKQCKHCQAATEQVAYNWRYAKWYDENDGRGDFLGTQLPKPVYMCEQCQQLPDHWVCEHCNKKPLFDPKVPLSARPPVARIRDATDRFWLVAAECEVSAMAKPQCSACCEFQWQRPLDDFHRCSVTGEHWCSKCMNNTERALCRGDCGRIVLDYVDHGYCRPCNRHRDKQWDTPSSSQCATSDEEESSD